MSARIIMAGALVLGGLAAAAVGLAHAIPLPARLSSRPSMVVEYRDGVPAHVFLAEDERWRIEARVDEIDDAYLLSLLAFEDKRFYHHVGVDPIAILRAFVDNLTSGRVVSGASTLTMQLVRVLEPRPRSLRSKVGE
ncbi:MAG: transglycosylase domain-containing protein, partial [Myxococcota bacterium]